MVARWTNTSRMILDIISKFSPWVHGAFHSVIFNVPFLIGIICLYVSKSGWRGVTWAIHECIDLNWRPSVQCLLIYCTGCNWLHSARIYSATRTGRNHDGGGGGVHLKLDWKANWITEFALCVFPIHPSILSTRADQIGRARVGQLFPKLVAAVVKCKDRKESSDWRHVSLGDKVSESVNDPHSRGRWAPTCVSWTLTGRPYFTGAHSHLNPVLVGGNLAQVGHSYLGTRSHACSK